MSRDEEYARLVTSRKACSRCPLLTNPSSVEGGALDSTEIGPYSRWHGNLDAELVVVAKDFAPVPKFIEFAGRPGPTVQTNLRLQKFLALAGFDVGSVDSPTPGARVFFTNAVLCLAGGQAMRTNIPSSAVRECGAHYLRPLLQIINPRAVVTLGVQATQAALTGLGLPGIADFDLATKGAEGIALPSGARLFPVPHPVASKTLAEHEASWMRIRCDSA